MDNIDDLPVGGTDTSSRELEILQKYFSNRSSPDSTSSDFGIKEALYASLLFVVMANPAVDHLIDLIPHTGSPLIKAGMKAVAYFVLLYIIFTRL